jgi:hypothetical protein
MKKTAIVLLALVLSMMAATSAPAFGKDMHVPDGVAIEYWSGGVAMITLPSTWPTGPTGIMKGATIRIVVQDVEAGTYGPHGNIRIGVLNLGTGQILPLAYFTTNTDPDLQNFFKALYAGMPVGNFPQNLKVGLTENDLKVERHGNRIIAELLTPQAIRWPGPGFPTVTIPPFKLELDKVGGSFHDYVVDSFAGYSGFVNYWDMMEFNGNGAIACNGWGFMEQPMTNCEIIMHGITTYGPPTP